MTFETARTRSGRTIEFNISNGMAGGMKQVFFTRDRKEVVAFFHKAQSDFARENRLLKVISDHNPTLPGKPNFSYWKELFCWPTDLIDHPRLGLGMLIPSYPSRFIFDNGLCKGKEKDGGWFTCIDPKTKKLLRYSRVDPLERGNLGGYISSLIRVSRAVQRMHMAGLAHADLSDRNVLIDPVSGSAIVIDLDALVVPGVFPPDVLGTRGFIAPEVLATQNLHLEDSNRKHACAETDKYALAVLIYKYLLERHPLEGSRILKGLTPEQENEAEFGIQALYSEHPIDKSNRPSGKYYPASIMGAAFEKLCLNTFVLGIHTPNLRPSAGGWEKVLCAAFDLLRACENASCSHKMFVLINSQKPKCPYCGKISKGTYSILKLTYVDKNNYTINEGELVLNGYLGGSGTQLYKYHTHRNSLRGAGQDSSPVARVVFLKDPTPTFYLQNISLPFFMVRNVKAGMPNFQSLSLNSKIMLCSGLEFKFGNEIDARTGIVETFPSL